MPDFLKQLFQAMTDGNTSGAGRQTTIQLATAALLVEMMHADHEVAPEETETLRSVLRQEFALDETLAEALIADGEREAREAPGFFAFTKTINDALPLEDKLRVMEYLWRIALADGEVAAHENHLLRKLADLLHVGHGDYHAAKQRALAHLQARESAS